MRYGLIGDIHGESDRLKQVLRQLDDVDHLIFLGDYVDRGPDSLGVLRLVRKTVDRRRVRDQRTTTLIGNHEFKHGRAARQGKSRPVPGVVSDQDRREFNEHIETLTGNAVQYKYRDDRILASHAPAALYQTTDLDNDYYIYGMSTKGAHGAYGSVTNVATSQDHTVRSRLSLAQIYPMELSVKPVFFGHVHAGHMPHRKHEHCLDFDCGYGGQLGYATMDDRGRVTVMQA